MRKMSDAFEHFQIEVGEGLAEPVGPGIGE